jgi:tellurite resistance protein TerC
MVHRRLRATARTVRRTVVAVIGATILLLGVALIALPGPAIIVIPVGLAILGLEFAWARRWMRILRERAQAVTQGWTNDAP